MIVILSLGPEFVCTTTNCVVLDISPTIRIPTVEVGLEGCKNSRDGYSCLIPTHVPIAINLITLSSEEEQKQANADRPPASGLPLLELTACSGYGHSLGSSVSPRLGS